MDMNLTADYHTHTPYSHGKGTVEENAARAKALGMKQIGITDHGFAQLAFGLRRRKVPALIADCRAAAENWESTCWRAWRRIFWARAA